MVGILKGGNQFSGVDGLGGSVVVVVGVALVGTCIVALVVAGVVAGVVAWTVSLVVDHHVGTIIRLLRGSRVLHLSSFPVPSAAVDN